MPDYVDKLEPEGLRVWLRRTAVPMLISLPEGTILWANTAYEALTGYSWVELQEMSWADLTEDANDRRHDMILAEQLAAGNRTSYQFRKAYLHKTERSAQVCIDVLRYPEAGEFQCFLVSVIPLEKGYDAAIEEMATIHKLLRDFLDLQKKHNMTGWERWLVWSKENPIKAAAVYSVVAIFLLGDRLLEIIRDVLALFGLGGTSP